MDARDRCDRCGAQAYVRAVYTRADLLFCAHHAREHSTIILATASSIEDETTELAVT